MVASVTAKAPPGASRALEPRRALLTVTDGAPSVVVKPHDTLSKIAKDLLGPTASREAIDQKVHELRALNPRLANANVIFPGDQLRIGAPTGQAYTPNSGQPQRPQLTSQLRAEGAADQARLMQRAPIEPALAKGLQTMVAGASKFVGADHRPLPPELRSFVQDMVTSAEKTALDPASAANVNTLKGFLAAAPAAASADLRQQLIAAGGAKLAQAPLFINATAQDKAVMVDLAKAGQTEVMLKLGGALFSKDSAGTRLIDSAAKLATGPMEPKLAKERGAILSNVLAEVADPALINQRARGTCAATSTELLALSQGHRAELVRLTAGLSSPEGKVQLANGDTLTRNKGTELPDDSLRTPSQRLLQSAFMQYAAGEYDNAKDLTRGGENGLSAAEKAKLTAALTGQPATVISHAGSGTFLSTLSQTAKAAADIVTLDLFQFQNSSPDLMAALKQATGPRAIGMKWNTGGHAVVFDHIEGGRVFFQNPQGNDLPAKADYLEPPPRRAEGANLQSMTLAEFQSRLTSVQT